jgi:acyl-coenzyme A thioesterase 9
MFPILQGKRCLLTTEILNRSKPLVMSYARRKLPQTYAGRSRLFSDNKTPSSDSDQRKISSNRLQDQDDLKIPLVGRLKNPIVAKLWAAREEAILRMSKMTAKDEHSDGKSTTIASKTPKESATGIGYPFSTDPFLLETYKNHAGGLRFGRILEDLDALAGAVAFNHVDGNPMLVTAGVDRIRLRHNIMIGNDQYLSGKVTWVGSSSMEIRMQCQDVTEKDEWLDAYFTFVALDPITRKPTTVPHILPETQEEKVHFEMGALKANAKKSARKNKLRFGEQLSDVALRIDQRAALLLEEAAPLLKMPSLADPNSILMDRTVLSNAMVAQPQVRNMYDRIFGGFLMRRAFELAYATAYSFSGTYSPFRGMLYTFFSNFCCYESRFSSWLGDKQCRFLEVDDVSFESPVDVGDLLVFNSRVIYTLPEGSSVTEAYFKIEVEAWVIEPEKVKARLSNAFYFTFSLPNRSSCRKVLPSNIDQARRMAQRMAADEEQITLSPK